jgi:ABC-type multidrug transport system fused ATPase/permease subunit
MQSRTRADFISLVLSLGFFYASDWTADMFGWAPLVRMLFALLALVILVLTPTLLLRRAARSGGRRRQAARHASQEIAGRARG